MQYFKMRAAHDFSSIGVVYESDWLKVVECVNHPSGQCWTPVEVRWLKELSDLEGDFPYFAPRVHAFSRRACGFLADYLSGSGSFLPLDGLGREYIAYRVTAVLDALDRENSVLKPIAPELFEIESAALDIEKIELRHHIFTVPESLTAVFVSQRFRDTVEQNGLRGFHFDQVTMLKGGGQVH